MAGELPTMGWPYFHVLIRLGLALFIGLLAGLERERRAKEAGLRTALVLALGLTGLLVQTWVRWTTTAVSSLRSRCRTSSSCS